MRAPGNEDRFELIAGRFYDPYDFFSFFYGWILAMEEGLADDAASKCFFASFDMVTQIDFFYQDLIKVLESGKYFKVFVYTPAHISGNFAAAYEYCNFYNYVF